MNSSIFYPPDASSTVATENDENACIHFFNFFYLTHFSVKFVGVTGALLILRK